MADDARLHQSALSSIQRQAGAYHRTLKEQAIRPKTPLSLEDARRVVAEFVEHYNTVRLHSALGYVTPKDRLEGRHQERSTRRGIGNWKRRESNGVSVEPTWRSCCEHRS